MYKALLGKNVVRVSAVHLLLLLGVVLWAGFKGCAIRERRPLVMPVEFLVAVPAAVETAGPAPVVIPKPAPPPEPAPVPRPVAEPPRPRPRPPVERSTTRITRTPDSRPAAPVTPTLSEEEIRRLLAEGARPSDRTVDPGVDARMRELIRRTLYNAWTQPSREDAGNAEVVIEIRLASNGAISGHSVARSSGNAMLDQSVVRAVQSVSRIDGLVSDFAARNPSIRIAFRVE